MRQWFTKQDLAAKFVVSERTVERWAEAGRIDVQRFGHRTVRFGLENGMLREANAVSQDAADAKTATPPKKIVRRHARP